MNEKNSTPYWRGAGKKKHNHHQVWRRLRLGILEMSIGIGIGRDWCCGIEIGQCEFDFNQNWSLHRSPWDKIILLVGIFVESRSEWSCSWHKKLTGSPAVWHNLLIISTGSTCTQSTWLVLEKLWWSESVCLRGWSHLAWNPRHLSFRRIAGFAMQRTMQIQLRLYSSKNSSFGSNY